MSHYELVSHWHLDAPMDTVWRALIDVVSWPKWWAYVLSADELERGEPSGVGATHRLTLGTTVPYQLSFTMRRSVALYPQRIESFFEGAIVGTGRWSLRDRGGATAVVHEWDITTTQTWMNVMSPVLGPMFRWNHGRVMAEGAQGLARFLARV